MRSIIMIMCATMMLISAAPAPQKKERVGVLKEEIAHLQGQLIEMHNELSTLCGLSNKLVIPKLYELVENNEDGFFATADRASLQRCRDILLNLVAQIKESLEKSTQMYKKMQNELWHCT